MGISVSAPHLVSIGGRTLYSARAPMGWHLTRLEGWDDSPSNRVEDRPIPGLGGSSDPTEVLMNAREFVVAGIHIAGSQVVAETEVRSWLASLASRNDLTVEVHNAAGIRVARCWVRGGARVRRLDDVTTEFELPLFAPDGRKYGAETVQRLNSGIIAPGGLTMPITLADGVGAFEFVPFSTVGGFGTNRITLRNPGQADSWVVFEADGPIPVGLSITSDGQELRLERAVGASSTPGSPALLLSPYAGGRAVLNGVDVTTDLVVADWMKVAPGQTRQFNVAALDEPGAGAYVQARLRGAWW